MTTILTFRTPAKFLSNGYWVKDFLKLKPHRHGGTQGCCLCMDRPHMVRYLTIYLIDMVSDFYIFDYYYRGAG